MFNTAAGGHIMERLEPDECEEMFESFAQAEQQHPHCVRNSIPTARAPASSPRGVHQVTPETSVAAALASMANEIKDLKLSAERCQNRGYNYNNSFGSRWRSGNNPPGLNGRQHQQGGEGGASLGSSVNTRKIKEMLENQTQLLAHLVQQDRDTRQRLDSYDTLLKNQQSSFQDLQRTVGDIVQSLKGRQGGPSSGPNASVMAVSVRSVEMREVEEDDSHSIKYGIPSVEEVNKVDWRARFAEIEARMVEEPELKAVLTRSHRAEEKEIPPVVEEEELVDEEIEMEKPAERAVEKKKGVEMKSPGVDLSRMPYPARVLPYKNAREYELGGISEVSLSEQCSAVVQNKLPEKLGYSGHFTNPCLLGSLPSHYALADLGASINLMPYSMYKQLDLGELQPTSMSISLADRSIKYPRGIVENLLVKVGKFVFPMDFIILDMEVDDRVPLILGRTFLRTAKVMIDVFDGKLTLRVGDEMITFDTAKPERDIGKHSHSVCVLEAFTDNHWDSDPEIEVGEPVPNLEESSDWAVELERLLDGPDEYGEEVPDDLLEMIAEFDKIIGKTPSVGKLEESVEDLDDPGEGGRTVDPTLSSSVPRSRPPRKRTRPVIESSDFRLLKTPSVGRFMGDKLLGYLNHIIFGPGKYKLWWKDFSATCNMSSVFDRSLKVLRLWRTGRPHRMKAVPVRIKEKPPDRLA
ncbi:hypothetical protein L1987_01114 [Smallanthus sonchifolius]|uniref:Uncharacterized protein n=1 Tax=Smallanthus sonchifolius TaxID=185202 RepID=A0ACB9K473_9ASTR|nr:hypothetical protein L1987_01114 [Smallanthus sonchifolius]